MAFRLVAFVKRSGSANRYFVERIPAEVRERAAGLSLLVLVGDEMVRCRVTEKTTTIRLSLRTPDPHAAKVRNAEVAAFFQKLWQTLKTAHPTSLTHRQTVALAGDIYRAWIAERGRTTTVELQHDRTWKAVEEPFTPPEAWQAALDRLGDTKDLEPADLEPIFGPIIDHALLDRGIAAVDEPSRDMILREFHRSLRDAFTVQRRQAAGDYTPAPEQARFPTWEGIKPTDGSEKHPAGKLSLKGLVDRWWMEAKQAGLSKSTHENYRGAVQRLAAFLKHDDAHAVTDADVIRFKDCRIESGIALKTIKDSDLAGLKSVFRFAKANRLIPTNPAEDVSIVRSRRTVTRTKGFTEEEAGAILKRSLEHVRTSQERPQTAAAKRWVPWLCAYTGARVGEIVQLRKEDVRFVKSAGEEGGLWTITITPEAGTVKDKEVRHVVLHPHLVETGFSDFVKGSKPGHLFFVAKPGEDTRGPWSATKTRVAEFARKVVPDERVSPSHGWRHTFKTRGREAGIADSVLDAICGHAPGSVGDDYGDVSLVAQARAFKKFPRFAVGVVSSSA